MYPTNLQETSSTAHATTTDADHRTTTAPTAVAASDHYPQHPSNVDQPPSLSKGGNVLGTQNPPKHQEQYHPQQQPTRTAEPYPQQETTWWEEARSPHHLGQAEQGYGPGPSGGMAGGHQYDPHHQQQQQRDQFGQYGGRTRDEKRANENQGVMDWNKVAKIICSIFLPPLGVFLETGCDKNLAINVLLTILGYIPGILHALYVIFTA